MALAHYKRFQECKMPLNKKPKLKRVPAFDITIFSRLHSLHLSLFLHFLMSTQCTKLLEMPHAIDNTLRRVPIIKKGVFYLFLNQRI